ncbi:NYN domain-containing protein [Marinicella meishanensis]|uniref:LabA-like NYN domain-containing protein n=1 Tax=Marinicella meishanensis TaxID=2873263 RepID=UPI001CC13E77|nr:NYN domain-containing protein [Marinicella sp. NBU2979]
MKKLGVFVDVQNIYYTTRDAYGRSFNYRSFWDHLQQLGEVKVAHAYAINSQDIQQKRFQRSLSHIGFDVKLKPFIQRSDGSAKCDWDVGIAIDIMESAQDLDLMLLLSGDGDFAMLLEHIMNKHQIQTEVIGVPELTANALAQACTTFTPIRPEWLLSANTL